MGCIERHTGIKKEYTLLAVGLVFLVVIMATSLGPVVTSLAGIVVPLQETLAILKQINPKKEEMRHMLVFWMVFGLLTALDSYSGSIVGLVPLWYIMKLAFLLWAGPLRFGAGQKIYDSVLVRIPEEWYTCSEIDSAVKKAAEVVNKAAEKKSVDDKKAD